MLNSLGKENTSDEREQDLHGTMLRWEKGSQGKKRRRRKKDGLLGFWKCSSAYSAAMRLLEADAYMAAYLRTVLCIQNFRYLDVCRGMCEEYVPRNREHVHWMEHTLAIEIRVVCRPPTNVKASVYTAPYELGEDASPSHIHRSSLPPSAYPRPAAPVTEFAITPFICCVGAASFGLSRRSLPTTYRYEAGKEERGKRLEQVTSGTRISTLSIDSSLSSSWSSSSICEW